VTHSKYELKRIRQWLQAVILVWALLLAGCGSLGEAAAQSTDASFRALIDLLLTDLTNQVADSLDQDEQEAEDMAGDSDDDLDDADSGTDSGDDTSADPAIRGETLVADNCAACHGADGASGFAPDIQGATDELITDRTDGGGGHTSIELSEQDSADIAAYLASF
jgi:mono/diheme cytochrome c family protein